MSDGELDARRSAEPGGRPNSVELSGCDRDASGQQWAIADFAVAYADWV